MKTDTKKMVMTGLLIAIGCILPYAFHAIPNAGSIFLPIHIPVLLCGLICGWNYGLICGIVTPVLACLLTGMPPVAYLLPMVCELALYGGISGLIYSFVKTNKFYFDIYISLIIAMIIGRVGYGMMNALIFRAGKYSLELWLTASFVTALPGILIQIVIIPLIIIVLMRVGLIKKRGDF